MNGSALDLLVEPWHDCRSDWTSDEHDGHPRFTDEVGSFAAFDSRQIRSAINHHLFHIDDRMAEADHGLEQDQEKDPPVGTDGAGFFQLNERNPI